MATATEEVVISRRTNINGTSYDLEHNGRKVRVRFRDSGELRFTVFGAPVRLDGYRHGSAKNYTNIDDLYTNIDVVPAE